MHRPQLPTATLGPFLATLLAIALLTLMDGFMKSASLVVGAYSTLVFRGGMGFVLAGSLWSFQGIRWPGRAALKLHLARGFVGAFTALTFFSALVRLPLAEAIALSFISPLIALALAALVLKEKVEGKALTAAVLGLAGVVVIVGGRLGRERMTDYARLGIALVLVSAVLYAVNLILQRQQAQVAKPLEIATFQGALMALVLLPAAPLFLAVPQLPGTWGAIAAAAALSTCGLLLLAWSYARAEAQVLVPVEYSGFAWAALFGWLLFGEEVRLTTLAGAVLIVLGCWIAAPRRHSEQVATSAPGIEGT
jgi:S-adenosylmethionine uptake transporter